MSLRDLPDRMNTPITQDLGASHEVDKQASPTLHFKSNHIDPELKARTDEVAVVIQGKAAKILGEASTSSASKPKMSQTVGRAFGRALTGLRDAVASSTQNIFAKADAPRSRSKSDEEIKTSIATKTAESKDNYHDMSAEEMKTLFLTDKEGNNVGKTAKDKQEFCKALLSKLGSSADAFVRERSQEMYSQVANAQSIGRGNTTYSALATTYLDSKLQFRDSEGFRQLQNAVQNPNENRLEAANRIWTTISDGLMKSCMEDPNLKEFMQQLYSSHLAIFKHGEKTNNPDLQDAQMKKSESTGVYTMQLSAEECAAKMVLNTLMLRVINPPIFDLRTSASKSENEELNAFTKIFQGGVNLTVKNERRPEDKEDPNYDKAVKENTLIEQTENFIKAHKDQILDFGRQFAPTESPRFVSASPDKEKLQPKMANSQLGMKRSHRGPTIDLSTPDVSPTQIKKPLPSVKEAQIKKFSDSLNSIEASIHSGRANKNEVFQKLEKILNSEDFEKLVNDPKNGLEAKFNKVMDQFDKSFPKTPQSSPRSDLEQ